MKIDPVLNQCCLVFSQTCADLSLWNSSISLQVSFLVANVTTTPVADMLLCSASAFFFWGDCSKVSSMEAWAAEVTNLHAQRERVDFAKKGKGGSRNCKKSFLRP